MCRVPLQVVEAARAAAVDLARERGGQVVGLEAEVPDPLTRKG